MRGFGGRIVSFRSRYGSLLFAVVLTAVVTHHFTMISIFYSSNCDTNAGVIDTTSMDSRSYTKSYADTIAALMLQPSQLKENIQQESLAQQPANSKIDWSSHQSSQQSFHDDSNNIPSRTWKVWDDSNNPFPCVPGDNRLQSTQPSHEGILFQRPTKVGSTTMTNIVMRLAHSRAEQLVRDAQNNSTLLQDDNDDKMAWRKLANGKKRNGQSKPPICQYRANHGTAVKLEYAQRNTSRSFLFSLLRDPTKRATSAFFHFRVSVGQVDPTDMNFKTYLRKPEASNKYIRDLTFDSTLDKRLTDYHKAWLRDYHSRRQRKSQTNTTKSSSRPAKLPLLDYHQIVTDILNNYDFIAVMERMDESLVALKLLLGLSLEEILYVKASRSKGSFSNGPRDRKNKANDRPCVYIVPSFLTDGMKAFFYGSSDSSREEEQGNEEWIEYMKGDFLLHQAANKSLDRTIETVFGRDAFAKELQNFQQAQQYANDICTASPDLVLGSCDQYGNNVADDPNRQTTCYIWSEGCDHQCLNERVVGKLPSTITNQQ